MRIRALLKKILFPIKIEEVELPTLAEQLTWLQQTAHILYQRLQPTIQRAGHAAYGAPVLVEQVLLPVMGNVLDAQRKIEATRTYTAYVLSRHLIMPLFTAPLPIAILQVAWNMVAWNLPGLAEKHINDLPLKSAVQFLLQCTRFYDKPLQLLWSLLTVVALQTTRLSYETKAALYILSRELPSLSLYYEKYSLGNLYQQKLGITITDPYLDAERYFLIHKNVPLQQAEIIIFCESHNNQTHQDLQGLFISLMSGEEDNVLQESLQSMKPCSENLFSPRFDTHYNTTAPRFSRWQKCFGWDDEAQVEKSWAKVLDMKNTEEGIPDMSKKIARLQDEGNAYMLERHHLEENKVNIIKLINKEENGCVVRLSTAEYNFPKELAAVCRSVAEKKYAPQLTALIEKQNILVSKIEKAQASLNKIASETKESQAAGVAALSSPDMKSNALIVIRNKAMKSTLQRVSFWNKVFVSTGTRHVLRDGKTDDLFSIKSDDPQSELREYLETRPHAILYPK